VKKIKILVVDDEIRIGKSFKKCLESDDITVDYETNGKAAIEQVGSNKYDVIFLDVIMPGLNGVQVLKKIKEADSGVKVVMITGYSVEEMMEKAKEYGAYASMNKPINISSIMDVIKQIANGDKKAGTMKCLVIDEMNSVESLLFTVLDSAGFSVKIINNLNEKLTKEDIEEFSIAVINIDPYKIKGSSLIELVTKVLPKERIIVIADKTEEENDIEEALNTGSVNYIGRKATKKDIMQVLKSINKG